MRRSTMLGAGLVLALTLAACGGSSKQTGAQQLQQQQANMFEIDQIERTWHKAASTHNVNLMMTLWAPDATFVIGTGVLKGKAQIRNFFAHTAGPFQPQNHWLSDTPAYKVRITVNGDKGTLYFECHYVDVKTKQVVSVAGADQTVQKIHGKWLITSSAGATPALTP
jgi:ketosteroid isomerase-like protein